MTDSPACVYIIVDCVGGVELYEYPAEGYFNLEDAIKAAFLEEPLIRKDRSIGPVVLGSPLFPRVEIWRIPIEESING